MTLGPMPHERSIVSRTLTQRFLIICDDEAIHRTLGYLACDPDIEGPAPSTTRIDVVTVPDGWFIREAGEPDVTAQSKREALDHLHVRIFGAALADRPGAPMLHTASLVRNGRRILLVAAKSTGKTTLTLTLATHGFMLEGDENVFITPRGVVARPRACRVKEGSLALLPDLRAAIEASPFIEDYRGDRIFNFDPRTAGARWAISEGPVHAVALLHANHGGLSSIRPTSATRLMTGLLPELAFLPGASKGQSIAMVSALAASTRAYDMSLGNIEQALALMISITES